MEDLMKSFWERKNLNLFTKLQVTFPQNGRIVDQKISGFKKPIFLFGERNSSNWVSEHFGASTYIDDSQIPFPNDSSEEKASSKAYEKSLPDFSNV